jgi:hypothetical protein
MSVALRGPDAGRALRCKVRRETLGPEKQENERSYDTKVMMDWALRSHEVNNKYILKFCGKLLSKIPPRRITAGYEDNIKMDLKEFSCGYVVLTA